MKFQSPKYWREKASHYSPETRLSTNGEYCAAVNNETFTTLDPTGQCPLVKVTHGKKADVDHVVTTVHTVFERGDWSQVSSAERKAVLHKLAGLIGQHRKELALLETLDIDKPIRHSLRDDIPDAARTIRWYAEVIDKAYGEVTTTSMNDLTLIVHEPADVIAAVVPQNFPLLLACWELGLALIAGDSVILGPSEKSPLAAIHLTALAKKAGLPDGVLSVVSEYGHEAGQVLPQHPGVDVITFTGLIHTGKQLLKDAGDSNMKRVWLEAGGKSANIVFVDCSDLSKAVANVAAGISYNQGRVRIADTRLLLEESITNGFIALPKEQAKNWQPGNPLGPRTMTGVLIDNVHTGTMHGFTRDGEAQDIPALDDCSHVYPVAIGPIIFVDAAPQAHVSRDEVLGPVLVVTRFSSEVETLALTNDSDYGLGAAVWARGLLRVHRISRRLKASSASMNNYNDGDMIMPFDGYKQSGSRRDESLHVLEKFSELKTIWISLES